MTTALWLQVEQLNREIARAWEGLRQQPGGLHCVDMLVRKSLPLNSRPKPASVLLDCSCHCSCDNESQQTDSATATPAPRP